MAQKSFSASVGEWVRETKARQLAVFRESAQRVVEIAQTPVGAGGNMPVDTGFLRASGVATLSGLPPLRPTSDGVAALVWDQATVQLVIQQAALTDQITFAYTANYARFQEYGAHGRPGRRFVALAAQQWPRIVEEVAREAQGKATT